MNTKRRDSRIPHDVAKRWLAMTGIVVACWFGPTSQSTRSMAAEQRPNIVFIMADDLGYGELGCYGQTKIRTPNIDRLASQGMKFTQAYAGCTVCAPSRSVLMSGYHGGHASVRGNSGGISMLDSERTVAEVLRSVGYACGGFGKWGLGDHETPGVAYRKGFDEFVGYYDQVHAHSYYPSYIWDSSEKLRLPGNSGREQDGLTGDDRETYSNDVIMQRARDFIRRHQDEPFFCYIPTTVPHTELLVPEDSLNEYAGKWPEPRPYVTERKHYQDQRQPRAAFAAMVTRLDREVGSILELLDQLELTENTIVFFTSDNGGQNANGVPDAEFFNANGPLRGFKGSMYEGGLRVPMIVRWPGRIEPGSESDLPWYFADVMPTLAEIAGAEDGVPDDVDGISVASLFTGRGEPPQRPFLYWETSRYDQAGQIRPQTLVQAVRWGDWKAILGHRHDSFELFRLDRDVGESTNVAEAHGEVVAKIRSMMESAHVDPPVQLEPIPDGSNGWHFR